jgi:hypothetical protein
VTAPDVHDAFGARRRLRWPIAIIAGIAALQLAALGMATTTVQRWLHLGSSLPACASAGISTPVAREGICVRGNWLFGGQVVYNVVDRADTLRMPGYAARLVTSVTSTTRLVGPVNASEFPDREGLLTSFEVTVTNTGRVPLALDATSEDTNLVLLKAPGSAGAVRWSELPHPNGPPGPLLAGESPIVAGATVTGWVMFLTTLIERPTLTERPADLELLPANHRNRDYIGQIRLWK